MQYTTYVDYVKLITIVYIIGNLKCYGKFDELIDQNEFSMAHFILHHKSILVKLLVL